MGRLTNYQERKTVGLLTSGIQPYRADYAMLLSEQPDSLNLVIGCFRERIAVQIKEHKREYD